MSILDQVMENPKILFELEKLDIRDVRLLILESRYDVKYDKEHLQIIRIAAMHHLSEREGERLK